MSKIEIRRPHLWKFRKDGFRDLLLKHRWGLFGAYARKRIHGKEAMLQTARREETFIVAKVWFKADMDRRIAMERKEQGKEAAPNTNLAQSTVERDSIRRQEDILFSSMANTVQPMAPDLPIGQSREKEQVSLNALPWEHADSMRARLKARFPGLTDSDLDEWMM